MGFSRQYWSELPFPSPGNLPNPGVEPRSPALQRDSSPTELQEGQYFMNLKSSKPPCTLHCVCVCVCVCVYMFVCMLSCVWLFATPWTIAHQAPLTMEFSRQKILEVVNTSYSRGSSWPRGRTVFLVPPALAGRFFTTWATWEAHSCSLQSPKWSSLVWPLVLKFYVYEFRFSLDEIQR